MAKKKADIAYRAAYPAIVAGYEAQLSAYNAALDAAKEDYPPPDAIFTHGRGELRNAANDAFMEGFGRTQTLFSFENMRDMPFRVSTFRSLLSSFPTATALSGKSLGARASVRAQLYGHVKKLMLFTYPVVRGLDERYEELLALEVDVEALFIIGDYDPLAVEILMRAVRSRMRAKSWWVKVVRGDHSFRTFSDEARNAVCNVAGQTAALWNVERDPNLTELTMKWDLEKGAKEKSVIWKDWQALTADRPGP